MIKDLEFNGYQVHLEDGKSGATITYKTSEVTHVFRPFVSKHQQFYNIYQEIRQNKFSPEELAINLTNFSHITYYKDHTITLNYSSKVQCYLKYETHTKKFESNLNQFLITASTPILDGDLTQTYHATVKHEFPSNETIEKWFACKTFAEILDAVSEWTTQFKEPSNEPQSEESTVDSSEENKEVE